MKKALTILGVLIALTAGALGGLRWWLGGRLSKETLVAQLESTWNCRAHIDTVSLVLLASPARLEINGCRLAAADAEVAKPLAARAPLDEGALAVNIERAVLEVRLQDLTARRLHIRQLLIAGIRVREEIDKEGKSSLQTLFSDPVRQTEAVAASAPADPTPAPPTPPAPPPSAPPAVTTAANPAPPPLPAAEPAPPAAPDEPEGTAAFQAAELGFSIKVGSASLERAALRVDNRENTTITDISDFEFKITEIDVNPADLANHNSLKLALGGRCVVQDHVKISGEQRKVNLADLRLRGEGTVALFDTASGSLRPAADLRLTLLKDSVLGGYMTFGESESKDLKKLKEEYGIDFSGITMGGTLQTDTQIHVSSFDGRTTFLEPAHFVMPDFELVVDKGGWLHPAKDEHDLPIRLVCGSKLQAAVAAGAKQVLPNEEMVNGIIKQLSDDQGRLCLDFLSNGKLSKPKIKPDLSRLLRGLLEELNNLNELFKKPAPPKPTPP